MGCARKLSQKFREIHFTKFLVKSILRNLSCLRFINTLHSKMAAVCSSKNTSSYVLLVPTVCKRSYTVHMLWRQNDRQNLKGHQHREKGFEIFFIKNGDVNISFFLQNYKIRWHIFNYSFQTSVFFKNSLLQHIDPLNISNNQPLL